MDKKDAVNKKLQKLLLEWKKTDRKKLPSAYLGMTEKEFQKWCVNGDVPERFL